MVSDGAINEGSISNNHVNRKMLKLVNMYIQNMLKTQKKKQKQQHISCVKKRTKKRKITNGLKKVKEGKQKFTEQHKQKSAELEYHILNLKE